MTKEQEDSLEILKNAIADGYNRITNPLIVTALETVLSMLEEKDKIIDLMLEYISNITDCPFENEGKYLDCERMCDVRTDKECWKQYFKSKAEKE